MFFLLKKLQSEWRIVFLLSCCIYVIGAVVFHIWAEAEPFYAKRENDRTIVELNQKIQDLSEHEKINE